MARIDLASTQILENVGIAIHDVQILKLLDDAGSKVAYDRKRARIPEHIVRESIRKAPREVTIYDRNGRERVTYGSSHLYFATGPNSPYILDLETN